MPNILDYLGWRGDLTLAQDPFNEVDSLVLCQLSYLDLAGIVPGPGDGGSVTLKAAARAFADRHAADADGGAPGGLVSPLTPALLARAGASARFGGARLSRYEAHCESGAKTAEQFGAMCFALGDGTTYVAFRGTDDTFAGWREDFEMSFSVVPSQRRALAYLEGARRATWGRLRVGGHSKGGNLAIYAAAKAGWLTRRRVADVWSHDGPGFCAGTLDERAWRAVEGRVHHYVPQFCIVGQLLEQRCPSTVVASATPGIMQHSAMNWQVTGNRFERRDAIDEGARRVGEVFDGVIQGKDAEWRRRLTDAVFGSLAAGGSTMGELADGAPASYARVARAYLGVDPELQQAVQTVVGSLVGESFSKALATAQATMADAWSGLFGRSETPDVRKD